MTRIASVLLAILLYASPASATLILAGTFGGVDFCAADNDAACTFGTQLLDQDPSIGSLSLLNDTVGGLEVNGSLHEQFIGANNILNSSSLSIRNDSGATVTGSLAVSGTDFNAPANQAFSSSSGTFETAAGSTLHLEWWNDPANTQGADTPTDRPGTEFDSVDFLAAGPLFSVAHNGGPFAVNDPLPFSMTLGIDFSIVDGGALISRGQTALKPVVPEPATLTLLGLGLAGLGARMRRRR